MPDILTFAFLAAWLTTLALRLWLALRQMRHVRQHRDAVPVQFAEKVSLADHQKAADYARAKTSLGINGLFIEAALAIAFTLGGGLQWLHEFWQPRLGDLLGGHAYGIALILSVGFISSAVDLPLSLYRQFVIEARFGFNRMTLALFLTDLLKQSALGLVIGVPVLFVVLWLMAAMGSAWWLWVWVFWCAFNLLLLWLYPTFIAPLFNKFSPLEEGDMKARIEALLARCGFTSNGLFVMDGSKRSAHGNAYFTGLGRAKRIVFFDTLLARLSPGEVEAVLAHELGHFHHKHVIKRIVWSFVATLGFLWLLAQLAAAPWFFTGLGVDAQNTALALVLFFLVVPLFLFPFAPVTSALSRRHEFEADQYAARHASADDLVRALVKLYADNAATLTPDPLHSLFYDSHPPAARRIAQLVPTGSGH